jgi:hypothetical protein
MRNGVRRIFEKMAMAELLSAPFGPARIPAKERYCLLSYLPVRCVFAGGNDLGSQSASHLARVSADFGQFRAQALTAEQIDNYVSERVKEGDAPSSINRTMQLLGQSYKLAIKNDT